MTRSPIFSAAFGAPLQPYAPTRPFSSLFQVASNRYPHSTAYYDGHVYLSSVGGNFGVSGDAKVEKFNLLGAKVGETVVGPYESYPGSGVYLNGCCGLCVGDGSVWVSQSGGTAGVGEVVRIDPATMSIQARIAVPGRAIRDAWWGGAKVWATCGSANKVVRIDPATNAVDLTVATAATPFRGGFDGTNVWVACFDANMVQKINPATGIVFAGIATGASPNWLWCETDRIFVANYNGDSVSCLDPVTHATLWTVSTSPGSRPHGMILIDEMLWICCSGDHYVRIFDTARRTWAGAIAVPPNPPGPCFDGENVWHGCGNANVLVRHPAKVWKS